MGPLLGWPASETLQGLRKAGPSSGWKKMSQVALGPLLGTGLGVEKKRGEGIALRPGAATPQLTT